MVLNLISHMDLEVFFNLLAVSGYWGNDVVNVAGLNAKGCIFGQVVALHGFSFIASKFDGILGMAWRSISIDNIPPVFDVLYEQKLV